MTIQRIAAFSDGDTGGNPAGVQISNEHPTEEQMQKIAEDVGYSETAFAMPKDNGWRVRYFAPESEVPFCGHATIALGAALAKQHGSGIFPLHLNETDITVEGTNQHGTTSSTLQSPQTSSCPADTKEVNVVLELFGYTENDLDTNIPAARANAGAEHLIVGLKSRSALSTMNYELQQGRKFMRGANLVTVMFVVAESKQKFHCRNPFASGGVYEDPATGAASAAFAGYLRDLNWPHSGEIDIVQGEDMGSRSLIKAEFSNQRGSSIRISGTTREIN